VDTNIEWEKTYSYRVTPVTRVYGPGGELIAEIEGNESAEVEVVTHDVFAPAAPERLLAVVTQTRGRRFVDLLWAPNAEKDISEYRLYRREENGKAARIGSVPVSMLSFQDNDVAAVHTYFYSISAVDKHGNESAKSQETTAVLR
jgi:fibronectin type 3 domain-containing protein